MGYVTLTRSREQAAQASAKIEKHFPGTRVEIGERTANGNTGYYHYPVFVKGVSARKATEIADMLQPGVIHSAGRFAK